MPAIKWSCRRCGSEKIFVRQSGKYSGIYCQDCGSWIQWLDHRDISRVYDTLKKKGIIPPGAVYKRIIRYDGDKLVRCSNCRCQLFHAKAPEPLGQFNLIDAKFCPQCGKEFLF